VPRQEGRDVVLGGEWIERGRVTGSDPSVGAERERWWKVEAPWQMCARVRSPCDVIANTLSVGKACVPPRYPPYRSVSHASFA